VNGKEAGRVTGCFPGRGHVGLASGDREVHFRKVEIKQLVAK
jgi:hypothetical protein